MTGPSRRGWNSNGAKALRRQRHEPIRFVLWNAGLHQHGARPTGVAHAPVLVHAFDH
jgi:hypothetical protein